MMKTKNENSLPKITTGGSVHVQYVSCGKTNCKCKTGKLHGPYYYYFTRIDGKLRKRYLKRHEIERTIQYCLEQRKFRELFRESTRQTWKQLREIQEELRAIRDRNRT